MPKNYNIFKTIDKLSIFYYILLVVCGWFAIYGATYSYDQDSFFALSDRSKAQMIWIGISVGVAIMITLTDGRFYNASANLFYWITMLILVATIFLAPDIKGSHSWLRFGPISLQPAEFAKFIVALALAKLLSHPSFELQKAKSYFKVASLILLPVLIIILQSETGSALVFFAFTLALYREGLPGIVPGLGLIAILLFVLVLRYSGIDLLGVEGASLGLVLGALIVILGTLLFLRIYTKKTPYIKQIVLADTALLMLSLALHYIIIPLNFAYIFMGIALLNAGYLGLLAFRLLRRNYAWIAGFVIWGILFCYGTTFLFNKVLEPHQQIRIMVVLGMKDDPHGAGYNVRQASIAIGSGGLFGKGFLQGTQTQLKFVPEQETDFIFCTIGEEFGFVGSAAILLLYLFFIFHLITIAERNDDVFTRVYGYCVVSIFSFHLLINIGMVLGLIPVIGIPLPFFSYGGSSLMSFTILLFILLRLDAYRIERTR